MLPNAINPPCTGPNGVHRVFDEGPTAADRNVVRCVWCDCAFRVSRVGGPLHVALDLMASPVQVCDA